MESGFRSSNSVISSSFARLKEQPAVWTDYKEYPEFGKWVMDLSVTNEAAERGVKNAQKVALSSKSESKRECNILVMNTRRELNVLITIEIICLRYCNCYIVNLKNNDDFEQIYLVFSIFVLCM